MKQKPDFSLDMVRAELHHIRELVNLLAGYQEGPAQRSRFLKETGKDLKELIDWLRQIEKPQA